MNWYFFSSEKVADIFECIEWDPEGGVGQVDPVLVTLRYVPEGYKPILRETLSSMLNNV